MLYLTNESNTNAEEPPTPPDSETIKVQALIGNEHSARKNPLGIPTTMMYGRKHYLIQARWWAPPLGKNSMGMYKTTPEPLPYTEVYAEQGNRWVNVQGQRTLYWSLNFMERLALARPPWCLIAKASQ